MSEVLTWYESWSTWKTLNLALRDVALKLWYLDIIENQWVFKTGDTVLELWCGQGHKLKSISKKFPNVKFGGLELSENMLQKAQMRLPDTSLIQWDMTQDSDIPDDIDVACYFQSLHHLDVAGRTKAAEVIHRKLSSDGRVLIIDSLQPENQSQMYDTLYRAYAVLSQYPWWKLWQTYNALRSIVKPWEYDAKDYWYFAPTVENILGEWQQDLFILKTQITPFGGKAISDILIFDKK